MKPELQTKEQIADEKKAREMVAAVVNRDASIRGRLLVAWIEMGTQLLKAKALAGHGNWLRVMKAEWPRGWGAAETLMRIAKSPAMRELANSQHAGNLPSDYTSVAMLADNKVPTDMIRHKIASGELRPNLSREQVRLLVKRLKIDVLRANGHIPPEPVVKPPDPDAKEKREQKRALIATLTEDELTKLGPIASWENDLALFATFSAEYRLRVLEYAMSGGYNRLAAILKALDAEKGYPRDRKGQIIAERILPAWLKLGDALQPLQSALKRAATAYRTAEMQVQAIREAAGEGFDERTFRDVAKVLAGKQDQLTLMAYAVDRCIPASQCFQCAGAGCKACLMSGWANVLELRPRNEGESRPTVYP